jgi:hypothetical protein
LLFEHLGACPFTCLSQLTRPVAYRERRAIHPKSGSSAHGKPESKYKTRRRIQAKPSHELRRNAAKNSEPLPRRASVVRGDLANHLICNILQSIMYNKTTSGKKTNGAVHRDGGAKRFGERFQYRLFQLSAGVSPCVPAPGHDFRCDLREYLDWIWKQEKRFTICLCDVGPLLDRSALKLPSRASPLSRWLFDLLRRHQVSTLGYVARELLASARMILQVAGCRAGCPSIRNSM